MQDPTVKLSTGTSKPDEGVTLRTQENREASKGTVFSSDSTDKGGIELKVGEVRILSDTIEQHRGPSVHDVAAFILQQRGEMTVMKLQKLVYYCQAWSLVWDETPLFNEEIQAWANGPVVPALYARHKGMFKVSRWSGDPSKLTAEQRDTILKVLEFYGSKPSQALSELTHRELPWLRARAGLGVTERGNRVITYSDMIEYYSSL